MKPLDNLQFATDGWDWFSQLGILKIRVYSNMVGVNKNAEKESEE